MKKIMFNDKYGLTEAVLSGRKTMTRRIIPLCERDLRFLNADRGEWLFSSRTCLDGAFPAYKIGEELAVAQSYQTLIEQGYLADDRKDGWVNEKYITSPGYSNKMFVRAEYMPHRIRITDIKAERLQDISEEDAMREGIFKYDKPPLHHEMDLYAPWPPYVKPYVRDSDNLKYRCNARYAFAYLIDKISGTGTWWKNPWVFAYEFALLR